MAILYKSTKYVTPCESTERDICPDGAEQEHKDSCDINLMIRGLRRGQDVRTQLHGGYGHDDLSMDGVSHRILKQETEEALREIASETEFTEEELKQISPSLIKKFGFKIKKALSKADANDDSTTNANAATRAQKTEPATTLPTPTSISSQKPS